ncbi:LRR receptor serine/threonine-protein kinase [Salix suchowensis]|nr:LRR receptor serine/threonine-protein kinase [Salix suchowensis]
MGVLSFCFLVFCVSQVVSGQQTTGPNEVDALNKLIDYWNLRDKLNITDDPYIQNATWATEKSNPRVACDCGGDTCHSTHLKIYALDISGEIQSELFVLKELMDLNLGQNVLNGSIPAEIEQLSNMQYLSLGVNNFTGPVPPELGNLTKLITLYIDSSGVSGPIPQEFANLKSLQILWASDNQFTGKLPDFFGYGEDSSLELLQNQKTLSILILRNCLLSGKIPDQLGEFYKLQELDLSFNKLTGQVPESFQDVVSLQYLYLGSNNLNGQLPANILGPNLIAIDVSFNPLPGSLPQNFSKVGLSMNVVGTSINANNLQHNFSRSFGFETLLDFL